MSLGETINVHVLPDAVRVPSLSYRDRSYDSTVGAMEAAIDELVIERFDARYTRERYAEAFEPFKVVVELSSCGGVPDEVTHDCEVGLTLVTWLASVVDADKRCGVWSVTYLVRSWR